METLAVVTRNHFVESIHQGYICVVDSKGNIIYQKGDPNTKFFFRSAAKPIQILPFIYSGGAKYMDYSLEEIAIGCASHSGEPMHIKTVLGILNRLGLDKDDLNCGVRGPYNEDENKRLLLHNEKPSTLHAGCSGKHAAMLAYAKYLDEDISNYEDLSHPVQKKVLDFISLFAEERVGDIPIGVDGCGLPIFMLPINKMALSYAKLTAYSQDKKSPYNKACHTVFEAMTKYPEMVAGNKEFCTELMGTTKGKLIGKVGAEAVYCLGIKNGNLGACLKIADGSERAIFPVVIQLLLELYALTKDEYSCLKHWHKPALKNNLEESIGYIIPTFHNKDIIKLGHRVNPI